MPDVILLVRTTGRTVAILNTFDDSIALVMRTARRRKARRGIYVRFIGPGGVRDVSFEKVTNQDFALLWERWMHPVPRTEFDV